MTLAQLAGLLADDTRASVCLALLDGRAWTAGELARHTRVAPSTISEHLDKLVSGGLLVEERQGRHRYLRLAGPDTARMVEDLAAHAAPVAARGLRAVRTEAALAHARTCYDHLAGHLGVVVLDALVARCLVDRSSGVSLTSEGLSWFLQLGLDTSARRPLVRECLDFSERRPHLAGGAGAALCSYVIASGWVRRRADGRALSITPAGRVGFMELLGISSVA